MKDFVGILCRYSVLILSYCYKIGGRCKKRLSESNTTIFKNIVVLRGMKIIEEIVYTVNIAGSCGYIARDLKGLVLRKVICGFYVI